MKSRVNLAVRTGGRETGRETGARVRHVPMDGTAARAHVWVCFFFSSRIKRFYFHFILSREEFCYFASLCSGSQTLTHILHHSFWFYSLSLSLQLEGARKLEGFWHSAGSKALKMPRVSLHLKFAGNVARVYRWSGRDTELDPFQRRTEQNEPSRKDTPSRRIIHF